MKPVLSKLKLKRLLLCHTQQEVADSIGISRSYLAAIENGREILRDNILLRLSRYYKCKPAELI